MPETGNSGYYQLKSVQYAQKVDIGQQSFTGHVEFICKAKQSSCTEFARSTVADLEIFRVGFSFDKNAHPASVENQILKTIITSSLSHFSHTETNHIANILSILKVIFFLRAINSR